MPSHNERLFCVTAARDNVVAQVVKWIVLNGTIRGIRACVPHDGGKLMVTMFGAIAAFERDMMLERQRDGIARAAAEGKYKGRQPTARAKAGEVHALADRGLTREQIARQTGIGVASVYRILAERRAE